MKRDEEIRHRARGEENREEIHHRAHRAHRAHREESREEGRTGIDNDKNLED
jgi:hypothetical protein